MFLFIVRIFFFYIYACDTGISGKIQIYAHKAIYAKAAFSSRNLHFSSVSHSVLFGRNANTNVKRIFHFFIFYLFRERACGLQAFYFLASKRKTRHAYIDLYFDIKFRIDVIVPSRRQHTRDIYIKFPSCNIFSICFPSPAHTNKTNK